VILTQFHIRSVTYDQTEVLSRKVNKNENSLQIRIFYFYRRQKANSRWKNRKQPYHTTVNLLSTVSHHWSLCTGLPRHFSHMLSDYPQTHNRTAYNDAFYTFSSCAIPCRPYIFHKLPFWEHISIRTHTLPASVPKGCCAS